MKLAHLLALPSALLATVFAASPSAQELDAQHTYNEHLHLQPLPVGALFASFNFTATTPLSAYEAQHYRFFPRSLAQLLQASHTRELHLRFSLGRWDDESWGRRPRGGSREGGTGVEIWAWVEDAGGELQAMEKWRDLVNGLSGLFCASLNFIDGGNTVRPVLTFGSEGTHPGSDGTSDAKEGLWLLHSALPHEVVCTENLTPFLKLLPCKGKAGISSLLDGHKLFDASWQTMSIDVRPICTGSDGEDCTLEIQQTVDMVLDIERSMRPRRHPIPRPPHIDSIECDQGKPYHSHDTCYPTPREQPPDWSLSKIFGRPIRGSCPVGEHQRGQERYDVSIAVPVEQRVELTNGIQTSHRHEGKAEIKHIHLHEGQDFDLSVPSTSPTLLMADPHVRFPPPPLHASRQMTGFGQERGGMHTVLTNPQPYPQRAVYLESLPWFLRPYMHTLKITLPDGSNGIVEQMYYTPALDRERGTQLELLLEIPAESEVVLTYDFEKAILRYTEYPPDANRGFDIAPAIIRVLPSSQNSSSSAVPDDKAESYYLRTTSLLLPLPTPDFSMPYNVIILSSTVIALGFGSIFNLLVRRFVLVDEVPPAQFAEAAKKVVGAVRERVRKLKGGASEGVKDIPGTQGADAEDASGEQREVSGKVSGVVRRKGRGEERKNGSAG